MLNVAVAAAVSVRVLPYNVFVFQTAVEYESVCHHEVLKVIRRDFVTQSAVKHESDVISKKMIHHNSEAHKKSFKLQ
jgi:hypothetical protein